MGFKRTGVYLGWVGFQNLGDEAMWHVCQSCFPTIGWTLNSTLTERVAVGGVSRAIRDAGWLWRVAREEVRDGARLRTLSRKWKHRFASAISGEAGLLGGGTFINRNQSILHAYVQLRKKLNRPVPVFGTGVANHEYWARTEGWVDRRKEWARWLGELPVVGVRGPYSKASLEDAGLKNVVVCGDPAVLLHEPLRERRRASGDERLTVAVNFGEPAGGMLGSFEKLEAQLAEFARTVGRKHRVKFVPVWHDDVAACTRLALRSGMSTADVATVPTDHAQFRNEVRDVDFLVAFKLHAGILAAACNVPFMLLEYQPKCRDFVASLGSERLCLKVDEFGPDILLDELNRIETSGAQLRQNLCERMDSLAREFENYCAAIRPLLVN